MRGLFEGVLEGVLEGNPQRGGPQVPLRFTVEELEEEELRMAQQLSLEDARKRSSTVQVDAEEEKEAVEVDAETDHDAPSEEEHGTEPSSTIPPSTHKHRKGKRKPKKKSSVSTTTPSGYPLLAPGIRAEPTAAGRGVQLVRPLTRHQLRKQQEQLEEEAQFAFMVQVQKQMSGPAQPLDTSSLPVGVGKIPEPKNFREIMASLYKHFWLAAAVAELQSMKDLQVWEKVDAAQARREGRQPIGCKWIFKVKYRSDGTVDKFKARLVAQGFSQRQGIDFKETFAPVMMYKSMRVMLVLACLLGYEIKQMDVQTAFLYGVMEEVVYMRLPGMEHLDPSMASSPPSAGRGGEYVLRLKKALYGTKQASRQWYQNMDHTLRTCGFQPCVADPCVYVKRSRTGRAMMIGLFVDDLLPMYHAEDEAEWKETKGVLMNKYKMKDLGDAEWVLGMRIIRDRSRGMLQLDQSQYLLRVLDEFDMMDCKAIDTPEEVGQQLSKQDAPQTKEEKEAMVNVPYMELVGSLLYASVSTRPDICHAVSVCSRFMKEPGPKHWKAAKRILRYLRGTVDVPMHYQPKQKQQTNIQHLTHKEKPSIQATMSVYCDADWGGDVDDRRSTSGCVLLLFGCPVVWLSKKQTTVALSTAEAEYMSLSLAVQEVKWLKTLVCELGCEVDGPIPVRTDNQAALAIATNNAIAHSRTKHIDIRHHYVREAVDGGMIEMKWVDTKSQVADVFTKALPKQTFKQLLTHIMPTHDNKHGV